LLALAATDGCAGELAAWKVGVALWHSVSGPHDWQHANVPCLLLRFNARRADGHTARVVAFPRSSLCNEIETYERL
jgi:hypothetical protein